LKSIAESCSRQLRGWADSLQNSEIKGQRHLTEKSRTQEEQKKRVAAVQKRFAGKTPSKSSRSQRRAKARSHVKSQISNLKFE